jgi:hypothetical protein
MAYYKILNPGSNVGQGPDDYIDVVHGSYVMWENGGAGVSSISMTGLTSCILRDVYC